MATKSEKTQDPKVIDTNEVPHRYYVKFRCGISALNASVELIDEFRESISDEMAYAVKKTMNKKDKNGDLLFDGLDIDTQFKISSEIEWLEI